jgi:hypothetical protein
MLRKVELELISADPFGLPDDGRPVYSVHVGLGFDFLSGDLKIYHFIFDFGFVFEGNVVWTYKQR